MFVEPTRAELRSEFDDAKDWFLTYASEQVPHVDDGHLTGVLLRGPRLDQAWRRLEYAAMHWLEEHEGYPQTDERRATADLRRCANSHVNSRPARPAMYLRQSGSTVAQASLRIAVDAVADIRQVRARRWPYTCERRARRSRSIDSPSTAGSMRCRSRARTSGSPTKSSKPEPGGPAWLTSRARHSSASGEAPSRDACALLDKRRGVRLDAVSERCFDSALGAAVEPLVGAESVGGMGAPRRVPMASQYLE